MPISTTEKIQICRKYKEVELDLKGDGDDILRSIPKNVFELTHLKKLDLRNNNLTTIPEQLKYLPNIETIDLRGNPLEDIIDIHGLILDYEIYQKFKHKLSPENIIGLEIYHFSGCELFTEYQDTEANRSKMTVDKYGLPYGFCFHPHKNSSDYIINLFALKPFPNLFLLSLNSINLFSLPKPSCLPNSLHILDLNGNILHYLPEDIGKLDKLQYLLLEGNKLRELSKSTCQLKKLAFLNLNNNQLNSLPNNFGQLTNLIELKLDGNKLTNLPSSFTNLQSLEKLDINNNKLECLPKNFGQLKSLERLSANNNKYLDLPDSIIELSNLKHLDLSSNKLKYFPEIITQLVNLKELDLTDNQITEIPNSINKLDKLEDLELFFNNISYLPVYFSFLPDRLNVFLGGNPLIKPPLEITEQGIPAIRNYFEAGQKYGFYSNNEIKLILVGNSRAGKTSIRRRLSGQEFNKEEQSTHGIQFDTFELVIENDVKVTVKLWDFGGQDLFHATHRFFLTERALYLVVWDIENEETTIPQQPLNEFDINHTVDYWLDNIKSFAPHSPIIVVQNKIDETGECDLSNQPSLRQKYHHIQQFCHVSAKTNQGIDYLKQSIQELVQQSKGEQHNLIGYEIPNNWYKVRKSLINKYHKNKYVNYDKYWNLCKRHGLDKKEAETLCRFLHDTAAIFYFGDVAEQSEKIVITDPIWAVEQLYEILELSDNKGEFTKKGIDNKLMSFSKSEKIKFIDLLKRFELIFEHPTEKNKFIAPQCLVEQEPKLLKEIWQYNKHPHIIYQYNYIHSSIMVRFLSQFGHFALDWWRYGILIKQHESMALVEADEKTKQVRVSINKGSPENRKYLIRKIFDSFREINPEQTKIKIPCTCETCQTLPDPYLHQYAELEKPHNMQNSFCKKSHQLVPIRELLWWKGKEEKTVQDDNKTDLREEEIMQDEKQTPSFITHLKIEYFSSKLSKNWKLPIILSGTIIFGGFIISQNWEAMTDISDRECNLSVQVTDRHTKEVIDNAKVSLSIPENPISYTDSEGRTKLKFSCKPEEIGIRIEKQGYEIYTNNKIIVEPEQERLEQIQIFPLTPPKNQIVKEEQAANATSSKKIYIHGDVNNSNINLGDNVEQKIGN